MELILKRPIEEIVKYWDYLMHNKQSQIVLLNPQNNSILEIMQLIVINAIHTLA